MPTTAAMMQKWPTSQRVLSKKGRDTSHDPIVECVAVLSLQRQLLGVTLSLASFNVANGLVGVFVPLVILGTGAPLWQVPAFYVAYAIVKLFVNFPIARFIVIRRGVHAAFAVGFACAIAEMAALQMYVHTQSVWWLPVAATALALVNGSLWLSQHLHISSVIDATKKSSSMATIETINQLLGVGAPVIGGFVAAWFGPAWLIAVALCFLGLAFIPLRMIGRLDAEHERDDVHFSLRAAPARDLFANFCWNIETSVGVMVWPIFLAVEVASYRDIGLITAVASVLMVITMWIAGRRGDKGHFRRILVESAAASTVINILRMIVSGTTAIAVITAAYRASLAYGQVTWASGYYGHAKRNGAQWIMAMEIVCDLAYLCLWSLLLGVAAASGKSPLFIVAFGIAAVAAWGCLAISPARSAVVQLTDDYRK